MTDSKPHIGIVETSDLAFIVDEFCAEIESDTLIVKREQRDELIVNTSLETEFAETLIAIFLCIYFREFLKAAAKDHYNVIKGALARLSKKLFHKEKDTAIVRSDKITRPELHSILFSILAEVDGCRVKFIFKTQSSEKEYVATAEAALNFLKTYYSGEDLEKYQPIVKATNSHTQIVVAYDYNSDSLYLV